MWSRSEGLQAVNGDWHEARERARRTAFSLDEFGDIEITKYDLDTARITGSENPRSYTYDRPLNETDGTPNNGTDVRDLDNR